MHAHARKRLTLKHSLDCLARVCKAGVLELASADTNHSACTGNRSTLQRHRIYTLRTLRFFQRCTATFLMYPAANADRNTAICKKKKTQQFPPLFDTPPQSSLYPYLLVLVGAFDGKSCSGGCRGRLETNLALRSTSKLATWNCRIVQPVTIIGSKAQRLQTLYAANTSVTVISIIKFNPSRISTLCMKEWSLSKLSPHFFLSLSLWQLAWNRWMQCRIKIASTAIMLYYAWNDRIIIFLPACIYTHEVCTQHRRL